MDEYETLPKIKRARQWRQGDICPGVKHEYGNRYYVVTIHGQKAYLADGDFIVEEPDGIHHYPCKPDIWLSSHRKIEGTGELLSDTVPT